MRHCDAVRRSGTARPTGARTDIPNANIEAPMTNIQFFACEKIAVGVFFSSWLPKRKYLINRNTRITIQSWGGGCHVEFFLISATWSK